MRTLSGLFLVAWVALAQPAETPAVRQLKAWLDVFNRGERDAIAEFQKTYFAQPRPVDGVLDFREQTGGFELKKIVESTATSVTAIIKEREGTSYARAVMEVESEPPHKIVKWGARVVPRPAEYPAEPRMSEADALQALRAQLDKLSEAGRFSGAVMVARSGKTLFAEARGLADREKKIANKLDTRFRIGSMNKMFTGVAVAQLAQAGKLMFGDPLIRHVPDYPNKELASKVKIHHLLTHTGGTGDFFGPEFDKNRLKLRDLKDYVDLYGTRALKYEPGSRWEYSNYGFLLLGILVERVSGQSYYDYVRDHIYKPAGMTRTDSLPEAEKVEDRSIGYLRDGKPNWDTLPVRGTSAGGGYSTVGDLVRFAQALLGHKLLNAEFAKTVTTAQAEGGGGYGYGFGVDDSDGVRSFGHGGGAPGMNGSLKIFPDSGYIIAALANMDPPAAGRIADFVAARLPVSGPAAAKSPQPQSAR